MATRAIRWAHGNRVEGSRLRKWILSVALGVLLALTCGCAVLQEAWMNSQNTLSMTKKLENYSYEDLFMQMDTDEVDAIWKQPGAAQTLHALVLSPGTSPEAAFLAAEILFTKEANYPPAGERARLATIYGTALEQNLTGMANPWGLPEQLDEPVGQHFVALGDSAIPVLTRLLSNTTTVEYGGSKEATYGNGFEYRVKDLAAFYIARIRQIPYTVKQTPQERDAEIEKLKAKLK